MKYLKPKKNIKGNHLLNAKIYRGSSHICPHCNIKRDTFVYTVRLQTNERVKVCSYCAIELTEDEKMIHRLAAKMETMLNLRSRHLEFIDWDCTTGISSVLELMEQVRSNSSEHCEINGIEYSVWHRSCDQVWVVYVNFAIKSIKLDQVYSNIMDAKRAVYDFACQKTLYSIIKEYNDQKDFEFVKE